MSRQSLFVYGSLLIALGVVLNVVAILVVREFRDPRALWLIASSLAAASSMVPFWVATRERFTAADQLEKAQSEFEDACREAEDQLRDQAEVLEKRKRILADRFLQYEAWMEYPIEFTDSYADTGAGSDSSSGNDIPDEGDESAKLAKELTEKDQAVAELLETEASYFFDKIKRNEYTVDGKFDWDPVRIDLLSLINKVARVYHPESENPLMETSVEQLLRATSRTCLHVLVLLGRLPVNVTNYNLRELHSYLRRAFQAYKVYQAAQPFVPYATYATYAGRAILGANPVTLGAQWALWKLGTKGAAAATKRIVNRQALSFLHDTVNIVGYEVAGIYGGDFRHRDKYWIYGVELTDLLSRFPLSRESLVRAFAEVGSITFRSEYDRVFLFRCIANHRSGGPARYDAKSYLESSDRHWVAKRLQKFAQNYVSRNDESALSKWEKECRLRLGVSVHVERESTPVSESDQLAEALKAIYAFAIVDRRVDLTELEAIQEESILAEKLGKPEAASLLQQALNDPPDSFEFPELESESDAVNWLIEDMSLVILLTARDVGMSFESIKWLGDYFRLDNKATMRIVEKAVQRHFSARWHGEASETRLPFDVVCQLLEVIPADDAIRLVYPKVVIDVGNAEGGSDELNTKSMMLIGWGSELVLVDRQAEFAVIWSATRKVDLSFERRLLNVTATLHGGQWASENMVDASISISRTAAAGQDAFFEPLKNMIADCNRAAKESPGEDEVMDD